MKNPGIINYNPGNKTHKRISRRRFIRSVMTASLAFTLPQSSIAFIRRLNKPVRIGLIADLHHDVMHDGFSRLEEFVRIMADNRTDAIVQLGDFAYPNEKNNNLIRLFNQGNKLSLHVIGNHDMDAGHTKEQCIGNWGMPGRYYVQPIGGLHLLVLDGNDQGSPVHKGGYASFVGKEQTDWLRKQLENLDGPVIVASHQPLAGPLAVDNAGEIQDILGEAADKVILAVNGHSHIDNILRRKGVTYLHINSASYTWVGSKYKHTSYSEDVHAANPWISHTCPYRDPLFALLTVDPHDLTIRIEGRQSQWVGQSPAALGADVYPELIHGEEIAPGIRDRRIERVTK